MSDWRQTENPPVKASERGRFLSPAYDTQLTEFDVLPSEWTHLCPCRFGEARVSSVGKWSGDSYRYDLYETGAGYARKIALRWSNGAGDGWLIDVDKSDRGESHLLRHIAAISAEGVRWDFCHKLYETACKTALASAGSERQRLFAAFCEGRMKKRKRGGRYIMEILPEVITATANA